MSTWLPLSLILAFIPGLNIDNVLSTVTMGENLDLSFMNLQAAGTIAVLVFCFGGRQSWRRSRSSLGDKMIRACGAGIAWPYILIYEIPSVLKKLKGASSGKDDLKRSANDVAQE